MGTFALGDITIGRVAEIELPAFPALEFLPAATPAMLEEARRAMPARFSADNKLIMSFHSFVLRTGRHTIVVDTCCGKSRPGREQFDTGRKDWLAGLNALGVKPEEVTHVMCTHLHWDHVGWNTRRVDGQWAPTFTNAKYIMAKREYDHWDAVYAKEGTKGGNIHAMAFEDSVLPIMRAERAVLVKDDFELDRGISFEPCAGHSPGHVVLNLEFERQARRGDRRRGPPSYAVDVSGAVDAGRFRHERLACDPPGADREARRHRQSGNAAPFRRAILRHVRAGRRRLPVRGNGGKLT